MDCLAFTELASGTRPPFTTPRIIHLHSSSGTDIINQDPPQLVGDSRICAQYFVFYGERYSTSNALGGQSGRPRTIVSMIVFLF